MKSTILLATSLITVFSAQPTFGQSCCEANSSFVAMAEDPEFVESHELPAKTVEHAEHGDVAGVWVDFETDGEEARGYAVVTNDDNRWILVFHEWWGLNENIQREAEDWANSLGVNVLAVDLYDGKVGATREEASALMQSADAERIQTIISGAFDYVGDDAMVGTIGWCFGGGWSLQAAISGGEQVVACVMYYGMPEKDIERLSELNAPVLGIFAAKDRWINAEVVEEFEENMEEAGEELTVEVYDADHAFANPSNPGVYDEEAAQDARQKVFSFFTSKL